MRDPDFAFVNNDIVRADNKIEEDILTQAKEDIDIINLELELADEDTKAKIAAKRKKDASDENVPFLTDKPVIYMFNVDENGLTDKELQAKLSEMVAPNEAVFVNAKLEEEMAELDEEDRKMFLEELGLENGGLEKLIAASYKLLGLISFLTAGEKETRAWTITVGTKAPQAAGKIHSDFERGFIRAEVVNYQDLLAAGSYAAAKEKGQVRLEGKDYVMQDGDVVLFRFNV